MRNTWSRKLVGLLLVIGLFAAGCGGSGQSPNNNQGGTQTPSNPQTQTQQPQTQEPQEEKRLVIYTGRDQSIIDLMVAKFEEKYPEYKGNVEVLPMGAQDIMERVRAEKANPQGDIWWGGTQQALSLAVKEGLLAKINPEFASKIADGYKDPEGHWYGEMLLPEVIMYNKKMISESELPKDWDDLLDAKWKDQIIIRAVPNSGTMRTIYAAMIDRFHQEDGKPDRGYEWLLKLDANTKEYAANPTDLYLKITRQEGSLSLWNLQDVLIQAEQEGMPFGYIIPESGVPILVDGVGMIAGAKHPQAAEKFLNLLFSDEVQAELAATRFQIPSINLPESMQPEWLKELMPQLKAMDLEWDVMAEKEAEWIGYWDENIKGKGK
ncbi:extracellular solute-binding protein [Symbiobacterium thermophilum]|uniref:extracellular solute-binding protein n=1 Tax=Symbiobacterium thermophilum TaxID=2734 RepID=UPI00235775C0|nr:extracellular solute-binding protein [Symbiobacterium thermophilum]